MLMSIRQAANFFCRENTKGYCHNTVTFVNFADNNQLERSMMVAFIQFPIEINIDRDVGIATILQRYGDHAEEVVTLEVSKDQAIQIADFLLKEFKVKKTALVQGDESGFDQFWSAYPNKEKKAPALVVWKRNNCAAQLDQILSDIDRRKQSRQWIDGFIPHALTYLNQKRYEDGAGTQGDSMPWEGSV